jgi:glycosyltransferase involved in cell wall biosynthesis
MFSVIIPSRDRPGFLERAVASVRNQTCTDFEIIIVNDGALPVTADARVIDNGQRGPVAARNLGVAEAKGTFIAFLDDDDWWTDARHLARAAAALNDNNFSFADGEMSFDDGSAGVVFARDADAASLARDNTILISTVCYRKSLHDSLGPFDEALPYYWDWDWFLRVARGGTKLHHDRHRTAAIQVHAGNMSGAEQEAARAANLAQLSAKHGLGELTLKNHLAIAREKP